MSMIAGMNEVEIRRLVAYGVKKGWVRYPAGYRGPVAPGVDQGDIEPEPPRIFQGYQPPPLQNHISDPVTPLQVPPTSQMPFQSQ